MGSGNAKCPAITMPLAFQNGIQLPAEQLLDRNTARCGIDPRYHGINPKARERDERLSCVPDAMLTQQ
jgi:hypothetical protein